MTVDEMLTLTGHKLEDPSEDEFTSTVKLLFLNEGQRMVVKYLRSQKRQLLNDLETVASNKTLDENGGYDFSDLSAFGGIKGLLRIKMVDTGKYADRISFHEYRQYLNNNILFYSDRPKYYVLGTKLFPLFITDPNDVASGNIVAGQKYKVIDYTSVTYDGTPYEDDEIFTGVDGVSTYSVVGSGSVIVANYIDVHYLATPTSLTGAEGGEYCDLEADLHDAIVAWACSLAWESVDDSRKDRELQKAIGLIQDWADDFPVSETDPELDDYDQLPFDNFESPYMNFNN